MKFHLSADRYGEMYEIPNRMQ